MSRSLTISAVKKQNIEAYKEGVPKIENIDEQEENFRRIMEQLDLANDDAKDVLAEMLEPEKNKTKHFEQIASDLKQVEMELFQVISVIRSVSKLRKDQTYDVFRLRENKPNMTNEERNKQQQEAKNSFSKEFQSLKSASSHLSNTHMQMCAWNVVQRNAFEQLLWLKNRWRTFYPSEKLQRIIKQKIEKTFGPLVILDCSLKPTIPTVIWDIPLYANKDGNIQVSIFPQTLNTVFSINPINTKISPGIIDTNFVSVVGAKECNDIFRELRMRKFDEQLFWQMHNSVPKNLCFDNSIAINEQPQTKSESTSKEFDFVEDNFRIRLLTKTQAQETKETKPMFARALEIFAKKCFVEESERIAKLPRIWTPNQEIEKKNLASIASSVHSSLTIFAQHRMVIKKIVYTLDNFQEMKKRTNYVIFTNSKVKHLTVYTRFFFTTKLPKTIINVASGSKTITLTVVGAKLLFPSIPLFEALSHHDTLEKMPEEQKALNLVLAFFTS